MTTNIGWQDRDANGNTLSNSQQKRMHRLRKRNQMFKSDNTTRHLQSALTEVNRMGSALGVPDSVRETAAVIYRRSREEGVVTGRSIEAMASAALYSALRIDGFPRGLETILSVSRLNSQKRIYRAYIALQRELGLEIEPTDPSQYLGQIRSEMGIPQVYEQEAAKIIDAIDPIKLSGHNPTVSAASALYAAGITHPELPLIRQVAVAEASSCAEVSIRTNYLDFVEASPRVSMDKDELFKSDAPVRTRSTDADPQTELEDFKTDSSKSPGPYNIMRAIHPDKPVHRYSTDHSHEHIPDHLLQLGE